MPIYDLLCSCGYTEKNVYLSLERFDDKKKCEKCGEKMSVDMSGYSVTVGRTDKFQGVDWRVCQHCQLRSVRNKSRESGGCSEGKKCRGYTPFKDAPRNVVRRQPKKEK